MDENSVLETVPLARKKLAACFLVCIAFLALTVIGSVFPEKISRLSNALLVRILSILTALVFLLLAVYFAALLFIQKNALEITTSGIRVSGLIGGVFFPWGEIESIGKGELPFGGGTLQFVGLVLRSPEEFFEGKPARLKKTFRALARKKQPFHAIFAKGWTSMQTDELHALMSAHFAVLAIADGAETEKS
ncbi:MAG: STM3941 family protein [Planctomycetota bacterium]|jgi:hypothetical protein